MKRLTCLLATLTMASAVAAHPGIGIVQDSRGNVFYTNLTQVWKVAPDGVKSVAVAGVHTHELFLDTDDNLYGEHLWYEGDATQKWGHRVWRLKPDGTLSDIIPTREGFLEDDSFVRNRAGNRYWEQRGEPIVIKRRTPGGHVATHATGDFRDVRWMTVTPDGTLFLIDNGDLRRVSSAGKVSTIAAKLSGQSRPPAGVSARHYHMGLWTDAAENVYVAVAAERLVIKVDRDGKATIAARSSGNWAPSGGMVDHEGNLWLLEYDSANSVRVRRIRHDGPERIY